MNDKKDLFGLFQDDYPEMPEHFEARIRQTIGENCKKTDIQVTQRYNIWNRRNRKIFILAAVLITLLVSGGVFAVASRQEKQVSLADSLPEALQNGRWKDYLQKGWEHYLQKDIHVRAASLGELSASDQEKYRTIHENWVDDGRTLTLYEGKEPVWNIPEVWYDGIALFFRMERTEEAASWNEAASDSVWIDGKRRILYYMEENAEETSVFALSESKVPESLFCSVDLCEPVDRYESTDFYEGGVSGDLDVVIPLKLYKKRQKEVEVQFLRFTVKEPDSSGQEPSAG